MKQHERFGCFFSCWPLDIAYVYDTLTVGSISYGINYCKSSLETTGQNSILWQSSVMFLFHRFCLSAVCLNALKLFSFFVESYIFPKHNHVLEETRSWMSLNTPVFEVYRSQSYNYLQNQEEESWWWSTQAIQGAVYKS